jgi:hypothetical protein
LAGGLKVGELVVLEPKSVKVGQQVIPRVVHWKYADSSVNSDAPPQ